MVVLPRVVIVIVYDDAYAEGDLYYHVEETETLCGGPYAYAFPNFCMATETVTVR